MKNGGSLERAGVGLARSFCYTSTRRRAHVTCTRAELTLYTIPYTYTPCEQGTLRNVRCPISRMSFSQKEYIVSHAMTKETQASQPAVFKLDLSGLIPFGRYSTLFVVDKVNLTAYTRGTLEKVPVKFTVLDGARKRVLTNDPCGLSSTWRVETERGSPVKIAGTENHPFNRTPAVYEEENRTALLNVLRFMMSTGLRTADRARGAFDVLVKATRGEIRYTCERCLEIASAGIVKGPSGISHFTFTRCADDDACVPCSISYVDKDYEALATLLPLLRSAYRDNLDILQHVTHEAASTPCFRDLNVTSFPPRNMYTGEIWIPYASMKYMARLYQSMSEYAENLAIVNEDMPHVKVLIESPSDNIGLVTGSVSLTVMYGSSLMEMYKRLEASWLHEDGEGYRQEREQELSSLDNLTQLTIDVLMRRTSLMFRFDTDLDLADWWSFYYG